MSNKDVNIHIKTPGADESARDLNKVGKAGRKVGDDVSAGSKKAGRSAQSSSQKLSGMGRVMSSLGAQVTGLAAAWLGMEGVKKLLDYMIQRLERIKKLQEDIYAKSLEMAQVGQSLEIQTGTTGKQKDWTKKAIELQQAGGLGDINTAKEMMVAMDIAFSNQGGIKNKDIMQLGASISPFVGANQMSGSEVTKLFEFAGIAGITPEEESYKQYFAKLQAGYTSSKATSFGDFMTGLQKGGTAYMGQGGSLNEAISAFASARSVTANESVAATLLEQVARFSSGAYEKPRKAIEQSQSVKWEDIEMDQRMNVLLKHIAEIPESKRTQTMIEQGFEPGLATEVQKMVTPEALQTMQSTRQTVRTAKPEQTQGQMQAYLDSDLAKARQTQALGNAIKADAGPEFAAWQRRVNKETSKHEVKLAKDQDDKGVWDRLEPYANAIKSMEQETWQLMKQVPQTSDEYMSLDYLKLQLSMARAQMEGLPGHLYPKAKANQVGYQLQSQFSQIKKHYGLDGGNPGSPTDRLEDVEIPDVPDWFIKKTQPNPPARPEVIETDPQALNSPQPAAQPQTTKEVHHHTVVNNNYHRDTHYHPHVGADGRGPRFSQDV